MDLNNNSLKDSIKEIKGILANANTTGGVILSESSQNDSFMKQQLTLAFRAKLKTEITKSKESPNLDSVMQAIS